MPAQRTFYILPMLVVALLATCVLGQVSIDFEDDNLDVWDFVDDVSLGDPGPSTWEIRESELGHEGLVLYQGSNIWGDAGDNMLMGTFALYNQQEFTNFRLEVDVIANDNDGMGLVWGYKETDQHYRVMLMNDRWPEVPPLDGHHGPMVISHKRISDETPWYELLEVDDDPDSYIPYSQGFDALLHWTLEVNNGNYKFTSVDEFTGDEILLEGFDDTFSSGLVGIQLYAQQAEFDNFTISELGSTQLQAGDADQDLDFDQIDLVKVQIANTYLTGQAATWGQGDWNGAPGGEPGSPPAGDGKFDQLDIIAALNSGVYLTGPYAAVQPGGVGGDAQTSVGYNPGTGEVFVDAPAGTELTSINVDSASGIFTGSAAQNLGGSFDNDADNNIFKATFGGSFGSLTFGNVAQTGLAQDFLLGDLTVVGSLSAGGALGDVDLIYVPEPSALVLVLLALGLANMVQVVRRPSRH